VQSNGRADPDWAAKNYTSSVDVDVDSSSRFRFRTRIDRERETHTHTYTQADRQTHSQSTQLINRPTPRLQRRWIMQWFHVQFIACNALQFLCSNCILSNVMYNIYETKMLQTYHIFRHVGKLATIAQKLQRVACNKSHMKPRHIVSGAVDDVAISGAHDLQLNYGLIRWLLGQCLINLSPSRGDNDKLIRAI